MMSSGKVQDMTSSNSETRLPTLESSLHSQELEASIPGRTSCEDGPGIDWYRLLAHVPPILFG